MLSGFQVHNGLAPKELPRAIRYQIDLSAATSIDFDLTTEQDEQQIAFVQSLWVDNSNSPRRLDIDIQGIPQVIKVPIGAMGCFPIIHPGHFKCKFSISAVTPLAIPVIFLNVPIGC